MGVEPVSDSMATRTAHGYGWRSEAYAWTVVLLLIVAFTFAMIDRMMLTLLVGPLKVDLHLTDTQVSLLHGLAFTMLYVVVGLPMGWLNDRYSRRVIASASIAAWSVMTALCGMSGSFAHLFVARMGVGIGEAGISPAANSLIPDYFPPSRVSLPLTLYSFGGSAGSGLALIFGGTVVDYVGHMGRLSIPLIGEIKGWQAAFLVVGLPGLVIAAATMLIKEPPRQNRLHGADAQPASVRITMRFVKERSGFLLPHFCASAACSLVILSIVAWMPTFLIRTYGYDPGQAGLRYGLAVLIGGISGLTLSGILSNHLGSIGRRDAPIIVALLCTMIAIIPAVAAPLVHNAGVALLLSGLSVFGFAAAVALAPVSFPLLVPNEMRGQIYALYLLTISVLGYTVGPVVVAMITDRIFHNDAMVGRSMAIVALCGGPTAALLWEVSRRQFGKLALQ